MAKIDFKKTLKSLYQPGSKAFTEVIVPPMQYLMVDGEGEPGNDAYVRACTWLFGHSYGVKFYSKNALSQDYVVPPLEGLWWADDYSAYIEGRRDEWKWTLMIMQPDWVTDEMVQDSIELKQSKLGDQPSTFRLETFNEGLSVQIMHIGPYADEAPTIKRLHEEYLPEQGYTENGEHHEIYISDPRRCAPEKMKTVLRQPVKPK